MPMPEEKLHCFLSDFCGTLGATHAPLFRSTLRLPVRSRISFFPLRLAVALFGEARR
jgi:hypothetical protein